ncbi:MAG: YraN family protein [Tannerellaceae bacterium]|jgi:putative endonuclease|nr:YraN family protein [Tannerellaceae bacterium]
MGEKNLIGKGGEQQACEHLIKQDYRILHTNWCWRHYELDIVATDGRELVVIEVKTRSAENILSPEDTVDTAKIRRTVSAADVYARLYRTNMPVRFDIITLIGEKDGPYEIEHLVEAYYAPVRGRRY